MAVTEKTLEWVKFNMLKLDVATVIVTLAEVRVRK
jgi:hypothetical protein